MKETIPVDGADVPLRAGMQGTARITVGRRRLVEFVLEPIRQLRENFSGTISRSSER